MKSINVIGVGAIASLGNSWPEIWSALLAGKRCTQDASKSMGPLIRGVSVSAVPNLSRDIENRSLSSGAASKLALHAISEASSAFHTPNRLAVFGGTTYGESDIVLEVAQATATDRRIAVPNSCWRSLVEDSVAVSASTVSTSFCDGWVYSSCTSSMHALILAALQIQDEEAELDGAVVVGVDALSVLGTIGFDRIGASSRSDCRPFHTDRDGTLVGEGAAAVLISNTTHGHSRLGRLIGLGMSCEAGHPTRPAPNGEGLQSAIIQALAHANVAVDDVAGIVLHGTGTAHNDSAEAMALQSVFGTNGPPATSIKGSLGHTMGAAGVLNCLVALQACTERVFPPTWSDNSSTIAGVDLVTRTPRQLRSNGPLVVNCSGFGGNNVVAVFDT